MINIQLALHRFHADFQLKEEDGANYIFDIVREKWIKVNPEELVRQSILHYLIKEKNYSKKRIAIEKAIPYFESYKRFDILYYNRSAKPVLLIECKSHQHKITQKVLDQIAIYNRELEVPYLMASNGIQSICVKLDFENKRFKSLDSIPEAIALESL